jgi:hypothetical protein
MVILYGHMSRCDHLPKQVALEDLWMALDMLPRFRWRWERKDFNGGHPLIEKLAERVMEVNLHQIGPTAHPTLMSEPNWDGDLQQPLAQAKSSQSTPTLPHAYANNGTVVYSQPPRSASVATTIGTEVSTPTDKHLADVPTGLFYPFYPESQFSMERLNAQQHLTEGTANGGTAPPNPTDFSHLLATAAPSDGCQPSQDSFMLEEKDTTAHHVAMQAWMNVVRVRLNYP